MDGRAITQSISVKPQRELKSIKGIHNDTEAAQYIADMSLELRNLAKANKLYTLQGLLEVAYYEAFGAATKREIPVGEVEHLKNLSRASTG